MFPNLGPNLDTPNLLNRLIVDAIRGKALFAYFARQAYQEFNNTTTAQNLYFQSFQNKTQFFVIGINCSKMNFTNNRLTSLLSFKFRAYFEKLIRRW